MSEVLATRVEPVAPVEETVSAPAGVVTETVQESVEIPLEALDKPYVTELLKLGEAYGHFDMKGLSETIDKGIKEELEFKDIPVTKSNYQELINSYLKKLNLPNDVSIYTKVEKLEHLISINCKLFQAAKEKQEFLAMNPADMSSSQLKRYMSTI